MVIAPGCTFTSTIPPLLVRGVAEAVVRSWAPSIYVCNVRTQRGETDGFSASDHAKVPHRHVASSVFQAVLVNTPGRDPASGAPTPLGHLVSCDAQAICDLGCQVVTGDFVSADGQGHDPGLTARATMAPALWWRRRPKPLPRW